MSEPFDFESFISGTQLARSTTGFYRVDHRDEINRLQAEHDAAPETASDAREGSKSSPRKALAEKIRALRDEMDASYQPVIIRTLTPDEFKAMQDEDKTVYDQFAMQSVEPKLTAEQAKRLAGAVGAAQWGAMMTDANDLVIRKVAVPDFSRSVSLTLNPPTPSES